MLTHAVQGQAEALALRSSGSIAERERPAVDLPNAGGQAVSAAAELPLVIDLDGTLLRTDLLIENTLALAKTAPLSLLRIPAWIVQGKAFLKRRLALAADLDIQTLPINEEIVRFAEAEAARGRPVYLATAADETLAIAVAQHHSFFRGVIASDGDVNLAGAAKAAALVARFPDGFAYAGNSRADLHVWRVAASGILVDAPAAVARQARAVTHIIREFPREPRLPSLVRALRMHQWAKNLLVFVPLILSGGVADPHGTVATVFAFIALGIIASATYLVNDLWDLDEDRSHWSKRKRPFASGALPLTFALAVPVGIAGGFALAALANASTVFGILLYLIVTLAYSFRLKRIPLVDTFVLAGLFTLRLGIGILACGAPPSPWLLVFSMFLFNSLSLAKRQTELIRLVECNRTGSRGYRTGDLPIVSMMGIGSGLTAILILVLYIIDDAFRQSFYGATGWLWGFPVCVFLFICRIWLLSGRGEMHDDPVLFAVKDRRSLMLGGSLLLCFAFAWQGALLR